MRASGPPPPVPALALLCGLLLALATSPALATCPPEEPSPSCSGLADDGSLPPSARPVLTMKVGPMREGSGHPTALQTVGVGVLSIRPFTPRHTAPNDRRSQAQGVWNHTCESCTDSSCTTLQYMVVSLGSTA